MGQLKDLVVNEINVTTPNGDFSVRGLSLNDILRIVQRHGSTVSALFESAKSADGEALEGQFMAVASQVLTKAPDLAAELIALGSGSLDDGTIAIAKNLPFPVQIQALDAIGRATFTPDFPPKKVLAVVIQMMQGTTGMLSDLRAS